MILYFFGDSLTLGVGDETGLGWPGRIVTELHATGQAFTSYNLGVRKDSTQQMQHRWRSEAMHRKLPDMPLKFVFSFGVADIFNDVDGEASMTAAVSMLMQAKSMGEVMLIGPTPVNDREKREAVITISRMFEGMCKRLAIPFVPTVDAMHRSFAYGLSLNQGDGVHPTATGYAELAEHILKNTTARKFFGLI